MLARAAAQSGGSETLPRRLRATVQGDERDMPPPRIGLFGLFGSGNSGNDGSCEAMLSFLRKVQPDAAIVCICAPQQGALDRVAGDFGVATVSMAVPKPAGALLGALDRFSLKGPRQLVSFVRALRQVGKLDVLMVPGTGILDDFGEGPFGMPLALFGWCVAARLTGTTIAFVSIGAGPIHHPVSRWLMTSACAMAQYRSYRDTLSKAFMESVGVDTTNDTVYPDLAFKLPAPDRPRRHDNGVLTVGVGVMTYHGWRNEAGGGAIYAAYLDKLTTFVLWLLDHGYAVRVLLGAMADRRAVADLHARVGRARPGLPEQRLVFDPMSSLHDLMQQIAGTDVVVATRYHNIVCALRMGKPTVSIGYADKNDALMAEMGLAGFCQHIERLDVDLLIEQFNQLIADRERYGRSVGRANRTVRERLDQQDALLAARVL